jgi:hypothetical protein
MEEIIHEDADKVGSVASHGQDLLSFPVFGHSTMAPLVRKVIAQVEPNPTVIDILPFDWSCVMPSC